MGGYYKLYILFVASNLSNDSMGIFNTNWGGLSMRYFLVALATRQQNVALRGGGVGVASNAMKKCHVEEGGGGGLTMQQTNVTLTYCGPFSLIFKIDKMIETVQI